MNPRTRVRFLNPPGFTGLTGYAVRPADSPGYWHCTIDDRERAHVFHVDELLDLTPAEPDAAGIEAVEAEQAQGLADSFDAAIAQGVSRNLLGPDPFGRRK